MKVSHGLDKWNKSCTYHEYKNEPCQYIIDNIKKHT